MNAFYNGDPNQYYTYGTPRPRARYTQPLTPEQIAKLRQDSSAFDMKVEPEDLLKAACTHREKNGQSTLVYNDNNTVTCTICHETFDMCDKSKEEVAAAVKIITDMLQTSKTVYLDAPDSLITQYYQVIPLLKKFPELWDRAIKNFSMYENYQNNGVNPMSPNYSGFAALGSMLSNPYGGFGYAPQAPMGYPQQAPVAQPYPQQAPWGYPQPVAQPQFDAYGRPLMQDPNPLAYGAPAAPVAPAPAPGMMPQAGVAPVAAPAPQQAEVQQQQTFNV